MSKGKLREDKTCLNCGTFVEERFCPHCGQENIETRKSFHYLFTHFVEDLVHYDSGFWKTMKYLLFYPARLTREYLSGRRQSFVIPVKLYIFISFVTFFISGFFLNDIKINNDTGISSRVGSGTNKVILHKKDSLPKAEKLLKDEEHRWFFGCKSVRELDSTQNSLPENKKMGKIKYWLTKKGVSIAEHNTLVEASNKFILLFKQNIPKTLFLYMPLFAFSLWLFHGKKRWYYFDHGIFTLHYFSFLLLLTTLFIISEWILNHTDFILCNILQGIIRTAYFLWPIIYFYKAHKRLYGEGKFVSFVKSTLLLLLNLILILFVLISMMIYTVLSIH